MLISMLRTDGSYFSVFNKMFINSSILLTYKHAKMLSLLSTALLTAYLVFINKVIQLNLFF